MENMKRGNYGTFQESARIASLSAQSIISIKMSSKYCEVPHINVFVSMER